MQRDLIELKKLIFEAFSSDAAGYHLLKKHPILFDRLVEKSASDTTPIVLPAQEDITTHASLEGEEESEVIATPDESTILPLEEMEKQAIARALKQYKNSRKQAAEALDIPERTLYRKIKKYNL